MRPEIFLYGAEERCQNYCRAVAAAGGTVLCSLRTEDAARCAGLLLPGGGDVDPALYGCENQGSCPPDPVRDAAELALVRSFAAARRPVLGICRGMQVICVAFGGSLFQDIPGHGALNGADRIHACRAERGSFLARLYGETFLVNSTHHQAVRTPGEGIRVVGRAEDGTAEALCHETLPVWGVQWHPERLTGSFARSDAVDGGAVFQYFLSKLQ